MRQFTIRRLVVLTAGVAVSTAVAACGSSDGTSGSAAGVAKTATAGTSAAAPGAATSGTLDVGFASMDTGALSFPGATAGAKAAAKYLNAEKGGIGGRSVNLVTCDTKNDNQAAQECGQKFASDSSIPFALVGLTVNAVPFAAALESAAKPTLYGLGVTPDQEKAPDTFVYTAGNTAFTRANAATAKATGAKSVVYLYNEDPSGTALAQAFKADLAGSGVSVRTVGVASTASDYTAALSASGANNADLVFVFLQDCAKTATTMQTLGIHPKFMMTHTGCLNLKTLNENPKYYENWIDVSSAKLPAPYLTSDPDVKLFLDSWSRYGPGGTPPTYAELGWAAVINAGRALAGVKDVTSASAKAAFTAFSGPASMGPAAVHCPGLPETPAICQTDIVTYKVSGGKLVLQTS